MDAVIDIPCEIWNPRGAAGCDPRGNVARLQTQLDAEGADIPCTSEAEQALAARGVLVPPDFIGNAGAIICAAAEYRGGTESAALALIDQTFKHRGDALPRSAARSLTTERVRRAMRTRRWDGAVA